MSMGNTELFLYYYLSSIVLFSMCTTVNLLLPHPVYRNHVFEDWALWQMSAVRGELSFSPSPPPNPTLLRIGSYGETLDAKAVHSVYACLSAGVDVSCLCPTAKGFLLLYRDIHGASRK